MTTAQYTFYETWLSTKPVLTEMPERYLTDSSKRFVWINICDWINLGYEPTQVKPNLFKIGGTQSIYYWYEFDGQPHIAAEFEVSQINSLTVGLIEKYHNGSPYASDLYAAVLNDRKSISNGINSIRISSDKKLSPQGLKVWKKMIELGHHISVYDSGNPTTTYVKITDPDQLDDYMGDKNFRNWQFVLHESLADQIQTAGIFNMRRMMENAGLVGPGE